MQMHQERYNKRVRQYAVDENELDDLIAFMKESGTWQRFSLTIESIYRSWFDLHTTARV